MHAKEEGHGLLDRVESSPDLQAFIPTELVDLSREIREFLISSVSKMGRYLGPNLGVAELAIALHRVFESSRNTSVFDTGHQSRVHKILMGRKDFACLREAGGLSDYPSREESIHGVLESPRASSSITWTDGIFVEKRRQGEDSRTITIINDSVLTGGMAQEGLNRLAASKDRCILIIVNDNGRSYAPTIGGLVFHFDALRTPESYKYALPQGKRQLPSLGESGRAVFDTLYTVRTGPKSVLVPQVMFKDPSLKYLDPVDGHGTVALENELIFVKMQHNPVILYATTQKGKGYMPAEEDIAGRFRVVSLIHPETGLPVAPARSGWASVFAKEIMRIARENSKAVGITAIMMEPVGLTPMEEGFPERIVDVGIAEQEALVSAAGVAYRGAHPVVVLYTTSLNRAFDQFLTDVTLHQAGVTIVFDRARATGVDGASHNGMQGIAMCQITPEFEFYAPYDEASLHHSLRLTVVAEDRPVVVRYPKGSLPEAMSALRVVGGVDVLSESDPGAVDVLLVVTGTLAPSGLKAARILEEQGTRVWAVDPIRVLPLKEGLLECTKDADLVATIEDDLVDGDFRWTPRDKCVGTRTFTFDTAKTFLEHRDRSDILTALGLDPGSIVQRMRENLGDMQAD